MLLEVTIQALYPFILIATIFHFLFDPNPSNHFRPVIWLVTMFAVATFKSLLAVLVCGDLWLMMFSLYGFVYFFGLLPSKIFALVTMNQTGWGTSARSSTERRIGQSFLQRSFQVGHLVVWYTCIFIGIGFFIYRIFGNPLYFLIGVAAVIISLLLYWNKPLPSWLNLKNLSTKMPCPVTSEPSGEVEEANLPSKPPLVHHNSAHSSTASTLRNSAPSSTSALVTTAQPTPAPSMCHTHEVMPKAFLRH